MTEILDRAQMSQAEIDNLPDSAFAYIQPGGKKDASGKTVPRSLRHFPIHDAAHVRNALARIAQGAQFGQEALPAVKAAAKKFGVDTGANARPMGGFCVRSFEFESRAGGDGRTLEGYAAVFNQPTTIRDMIGEFNEVILPGAFTRSLEKRTPVLQFDHGKDPRVGTVPIGSIEALSEDSQGLYVRAQLFDNPVVEPVRQAIAGRAIRGMSFRFSVPEGGDTWSTRDGMDYREISQTDTRELGPVVFPAYDQTSVSVRSLISQLDPDELRTLIRELAEEMRALTDLTGAPAARSTGRGEPGASAPQVTHRQRLDSEALLLRGINLSPRRKES